MAEETEVSLHFSDYWRVVKNRWPIILTIFVLVVATAYFYSKSLDKIYAASAVIEVDRENKQLDVFRQSMNTFEPVFFQTEFERIQSKIVLNRVIALLGLREKYSNRLGLPADQPLTEDQTYTLLRKEYLTVQPYRNTKLIEITAYSVDPAEAALIANTVASEYAAYRVENIKQRTTAGLATLKEELEKQKAEVDRAKDRVEKLRRELQIDIAGGIGANTTLQDLELQRKEAMLSEMKADVLARRVRLDKVKGLTIDQIENVLKPLGLEDATISTVKQNYLQAETFLESLKKQGIGPEHPRMQQAEAQLAKLRSQLNSLISGIKTSLEIDLSVAQSKLDSLEAEVSLLKERARGVRGDKLAPYEEAQRELETQQSIYALIAARYKQEAVDAQISIQPVTLINQAEVPPINRPVKPNLILNVALSAFVGLVLGVSLAFFIEYLDTSVKSLDDVERYLGTSVVGVIPEGVNTLNLEGPDSPNAEAYRILRAKIDLKARPEGAHTLTIVSGGPGEGKSTTLFNLAYVCAYSGINTLVIDTDFRRHSVNAILGINNDHGLADFLLGHSPLHECIRTTDIPNLHVMTAGKLPPQCMGALSPAKMSEIIQTLKPHYDVILFDAPPILGISDAAVIVHEVDTTLLVIQHRRYPRNISWRAKKAVEEVGGRFGGVILNKVQLRTDESYYYYTTYYGYYGYYKSGSKKETQKKAREKKRQLEKKNKQFEQTKPTTAAGVAPEGQRNDEF
jgi:capsular exopolysaccharide synthesis family protein